jgi:hypothetical protein
MEGMEGENVPENELDEALEIVLQTRDEHERRLRTG